MPPHVSAWPPATRRSALLGVSALGLALSAGAARAQPAPLSDDALVAEVEDIIRRAIAQFGQPGCGVALVREGQVLLAKGFGVRKLGETPPADAETLFPIASVTKSFTAATLGVLADEGRLSFDDPVRKHLPAFALSDPAVSEQITVRDLLVHNSGLSLGAGDLMVWPRTTHTRAEIVAGLRHLPLVRPFRSGYAYDNVLYVAAGEVAAAAGGGRDLEAVMDQRVLGPLGADGTARGAGRRMPNQVFVHGRVSTPVRGVGPLTVLDEPDIGYDNALGAGGLALSARDGARWMQVHLGKGSLPGGKRLWSEAVQTELWTPRTIQRVWDGPTPDRPDRSTFNLYALGWEVCDYRGRKLVWHGGYSSGARSSLSMLPSLGAGVAIFTNAEEHAFNMVVRNTILDRLMGVRDKDWLAFAVEREARRHREAAVAPAAAGRPAGAPPPSMPLQRYAGTYRDAWYGEVRIVHKGAGLTVDFTKTPGMSGPLEPWSGETFRTRFTDRNMEDALLTFVVADGQVAAIEAKAFSPEADFSFDYQDLRLKRV